jgi:hypothetical protein
MLFCQGTVSQINVKKKKKKKKKMRGCTNVDQETSHLLLSKLLFVIG